MMLIDSNVFMYAAGRPHPHKAPSVALLEAIASGRIEACVSAEILQEILHRYRAIGRWEDGSTVYGLARRIVPVTLPVDSTLLDAAHALLDRYPRIMARDGLHAATCMVHKLKGVCSFDTDFDGIRKVRRYSPERVV